MGDSTYRCPIRGHFQALLIKMIFTTVIDGRTGDTFLLYNRRREAVTVYCSKKGCVDSAP